MRQEPWEKEPLGPGQVEQVSLGDRGMLTLDRIRFYSEELKEPRFLLALKPRSGKPVNEVFILNHGWADRPEDLLRYLKVDEVYAKLLAEGKVRPALIVLPCLQFPDYYRRNSAQFPFPQYLALVAEEGARVVSAQYGVPFTREKWSTGGFSFGGYVALDIGRRYSGRFHSISVISSFYDEEWAFWPKTPPDPGRLDARGRGKQTLVDPGPPPRILLGCGANDRFFGRMQGLRDRLTSLGIEYEWTSGPGGHTWSYWASVLDKMFQFHLSPVASRRDT